MAEQLRKEKERQEQERQFYIKEQKRLKELEKELSNDINFVKTHRSCIVNLKQIKSVDFENNIICSSIYEI